MHGEGQHDVGLDIAANGDQLGLTVAADDQRAGAGAADGLVADGRSVLDVELSFLPASAGWFGRGTGDNSTQGALPLSYTNFLFMAGIEPAISRDSSEVTVICATGRVTEFC